MQVSIFSGAKLVLALLVSISIELVSTENCTTLTTFNTRLQPEVKEYYNRRKLIPDALASESSDVLCLQEVWFEDDARNIINGLSSLYPHHFSAIHTKKNQLKNDKWKMWSRSACSAKEIAYLTLKLAPCALKSGCLGKFIESTEEGLFCLSVTCGHVLRQKNVNSSCISCMGMTATSAGLLKKSKDFLDRCHKVFGADNRMNNPGLVLLSKKPMTGEHFKSYFPGKDQIFQRGYIQAQIQDVGTVVCTHFTPLLPRHFENHTEFQNYQLQNYQQQKLVEVKQSIQRLAGTDHVLLGDLNTGIAVNNSNPEKDLSNKDLPSFQLLKDANYDVLKYLSDDGRCTYCKSNAITKDYNGAIDHVLIKGDSWASVQKQRVLDQTNPFLSDHYGVRAKLCR